MLTIGVFAKTFPPRSLAENADAVIESGFRSVHYNLSCAGLASMPDRIHPAVAAEIGEAMARRGITVASVGGSFNMVHPDGRRRQSGLRRLQELASSGPALGTSVVTVCTGTRDPDDMWKRHRDNGTSDAWHDLCQVMERALTIAEDARISLGVEPEIDNVVSSAHLARRLLNEMRSPSLRIVFDPVNLLRPGDRPRMRYVIDEAFELLGESVVLAHAKDVRFAGQEVVHCPAGTGILDYRHYLARLRELPEVPPLIAHGVSPEEVLSVLSFLKDQVGLFDGPHRQRA